MLSCLFAYGIIPALTLFFVMGSGMTDLNFTVLGNALGRRELFLIWGAVFAGFISLSLVGIIKYTIGTVFEKLTLISAVFLLISGIILPYFPEKWPNMAWLHTACCFMAAVMADLCVTHIIIRLRKGNRAKYRRYFYWNWANIALSAVFFTEIGMVTSLLEVFFSLSFTFMIQSLRQNIRKI